MTATWLVAKHVADLRRREPTNVGVILFVPGNVLFRFRGQTSEGWIDGRRARFAGSPPMYKAWVHYWQHRASSSPESSPAEFLEQRPGQNYYLEFGGERLFDGTQVEPHALLNDLFGLLVDESPERDDLNVWDLSETVLAELELSEADLSRDFQLPTNSADAVFFDYRYDNGRVNLMKTVSLGRSDKQSWDQVHAASWDLRQARDHAISEDQQLVVLAKTREPDTALSHQVEVLEGGADALVDLTADDPTDRLGSILGVI